MTSKTKKRKSLLKIILIAFSSLAALMFLFFLILYILFLVNKDDIKKSFLSTLNQNINGQILFSDIGFSPFRHFPNAAIEFDDLSLYENKDSIESSNKLPVFEISETFISVNLIDLLSSKINVSKITIEGGSLNVIVYPDSQTNFEKALVKVKKDEKIVDEKAVSEKIDDKLQGISLKIDDLGIIDLQLNLENQFKKNKVQVKINELSSEISYFENHISTSIELDTHIDSLIKNSKLLLSDQRLYFESKLEIDTDSIYVKIEGGSFSIGSAKLLFDGTFDSRNQGYLDLSVSGSGKNFGLLSLILRDEGIKNLMNGEALIKGSIKGKTLIEFPQIEVAFGLKEVEIVNPITKRRIKHLNLKGDFDSGKSDDWSDASLIVDTLYGDLQDGRIRLSGSVRNLKEPKVDINVFLSGDVTGLEKVFKLGAISELYGKIQFSDRIIGKYLVEEKKFESEINTAKLSLENFGIKIPGTIVFDKVNGILRRENDDFYFDSLSVISEDTDILINGKVQNLAYLFLGMEKDIEADLDIKSSVFDLPNFLAFDPSIKRDFNYRILDVDVSVIAKTTTSKAIKFKSFPELDFDIKKLDATVENFLPRIEINSGNYRISESVLGFNMKLENLKTDFMGGKFNYSAEYNTSKFQPYYIKMNADFKDIYLSKLFPGETDSIPEDLRGKLSGSIITEFQFPTDSTFLKFIKFKNSDIVYEFSKDTITASNLSFEFKDIYFNESIDSNPLATLYTSGILKADTIRSSSFNIKNFDYEINVLNGSFELKQKVVRLFGEDAVGKSTITITPFTDIPSFKLILDDIRFSAEKMLQTFNEDSVITGPLQLSLNLTSHGTEWDSILSNMTGTINLLGTNLTLYGMDADEIIDKFKRSQSFNLVDLGAVLLAGPAGIAVTKGTDFARIFVLNSGKSTRLVEFASNWTINDGVFKIVDAAFATEENRIALTGMIGFSNSTLDLIVALLDEDGCSIFSQELSGDLNNPTMGKVKVVGTVLAPVTNLVDDVTGKDCIVFYKGIVKHPK